MAAPKGNCNSTGNPGTCHEDSDCTSGTDGRCNQLGGPLPGCGCDYDTCMQDTDCPTGQTCACHGSPDVGGAGNTCTASGCRVDTDCGTDGYCSPAYNTMSCGGLLGYFCHTASDACVDDTDCPSSMGPQVCTYSSTQGHWICGQVQLCP
jgi:hypothetical protein